MLSDTEKVSLIKEALQDLNKGALSTFTFAMIVGGIVDQPEVSLEDLGWGASRLSVIRQAAQQSVQRTGGTCPECGGVDGNHAAWCGNQPTTSTSG